LNCTASDDPVLQDTAGVATAVGGVLPVPTQRIRLTVLPQLT
jgi:hypothetical protein